MGKDCQIRLFQNMLLNICNHFRKNIYLFIYSIDKEIKIKKKTSQVKCLETRVIKDALKQK